MHRAPLSDTLSAGASQPPCPLVSVIIAYYKQEGFIAETVRSVQQQTYPNVEIIVVDDGSPVPVTSVLPETNHVRIIRTENRGCPAARNFGFQQSSGDLLVFLDSDDRLTPGALEAHLKAFAECPAAALSFGAQRFIDEHSREIRAPHNCRPRNNYFLMLLEGNPIGTPGAAMIRREAFIEAGLFDESVRIVEDYPLYLRLAKKHPIVQSPACVIDYRWHTNSMSRDKEGMFKGIMRALDQLEAETELTATERRRLRHGRRRWRHEFRPKETLSYRLEGLYYRFRAMLTVPLRFYF
jgi:cellulose synthase/poly-beta-1,6-N-acetylglucosamine synthase-like glycosyltransferase